MNTSFNPFSLEGKSILVVGASSGIGREIALECSMMGAKIIAVARREEKLQELLAEMPGESNSIIKADVSKQEDLERIVAEIEPVDGFVMAAGVPQTLPIQFLTREKIDEVMNVNLYPYIELTRLLYKKKKIKKEGSIVYIGSVAGCDSTGNGNTCYGISKGALNRFMKFAALEFATRKIRVNSINPGMVETDLIRQGGVITEEDFERDRQKYPLKRYGRVQDIAPMAIYLLSDASSWVTGQALLIDGGLTVN